MGSCSISDVQWPKAKGRNQTPETGNQITIPTYLHIHPYIALTQIHIHEPSCLLIYQFLLSLIMNQELGTRIFYIINKQLYE